MDINQIIEDLQNELYKSKNFLWSKKSLVDMDKCSALVDELKRAIPPAVQEATYVLSQRDKILTNAEETARRTLAEAEKRAEQIVSDSALVQKAEDEARQMKMQMQATCQNMLQVTKDNVDKMLKAVEDYLMENINIIRNNREEIASANLLKRKHDDSVENK